MRIERARAYAKLLVLLYRLGIISAKRIDKMIDELTVKSLETQMKEWNDAKPSEDK